MERAMGNHQSKHTINFNNTTIDLWVCRLLLCIVFAVPFTSNGAKTDTIFSQYNSQFLIKESQPQAFHFFLGGHLYGDGGHQGSLYPSPSIIGNIDTINDSDASFFVSLGDNVRVSNKIQWSNFATSFTEKLNMPFFSVVGNHDTLENPEMCLKLFGSSYYTFRYQNNAFIFIDTIVNDGRIEGEQLDWLEGELMSCKKDGVSNVFLIGHMIIWQDSLGDPDFKLQNSYEGIFNFEEAVLPKLVDLRNENVGVFVFSDDIGGGDNNSNFMFHHEDKANGIEYMSTGIGNNKNDALIHAFVDAENNVRFEGFSLTGKVLPDIERFDINYWKKNTQYRSISNKFKKRLYNNNFRLGAIFCFALMFSLFVLWRIIIVVKRLKHGKR